MRNALNKKKERLCISESLDTKGGARIPDVCLFLVKKITGLGLIKISQAPVKRSCSTSCEYSVVKIEIYLLPCHLEEGSAGAAAAFATFHPRSRCMERGFLAIGRNTLGPEN